MFPKLFRPTVTFKLEIRGWRLRIFNNFEIIRTLYSNSERSEQLLKKDAFWTSSWRLNKNSNWKQNDIYTPTRKVRKVPIFFFTYTDWNLFIHRYLNIVLHCSDKVDKSLKRYCHWKNSHIVQIFWEGHQNLAHLPLII